jgi:DUF971 family protein
MQLIPTSVQPFSPFDLFLGWNDGSSYSLPYHELRYQCPCAHCVDEHTGRRMIERDQIRPEVRVTAVDVMGRYAVQFTWSDGHRTGIYPFERLWDLCQSSGVLLKGNADTDGKISENPHAETR